ncbi:MAG: polyprenyl synthetase family protein [Mariniphaga sp.]|nr:polyprenyl synthetase family protein [Mariniphaga sp.]MDD4225911.1 polyprenyl synthetase family protein [Mariniphaga sp.]MDD4424380.1 polyprenyl synthetase family protein [Mariniphaga sp.]
MYTFDELQLLINGEMARRMTRLASRKPAELYAPVNYTLEVGGKRLRPALLLMAYNLFSDDVEKALPAALAVEVFHNFTLLHDDIMDKAEVRRNMPAAHIKFSENNAILSGDAMAFISYQYLMECRSGNMPEMLSLFTETALEVCEGQQYDMDFENRSEVSENEYLKMIRLKTAVLLGCSLKAGALLAEISDETANQLYQFGMNLGMAFQLQDDWLDTFGNQKNFGKKIGGDILANKKTYLLVKALENATGDVKKRLVSWLHGTDFNADKKINAVTEIYQQLGIADLTEKKIEYFIRTAEKIFDSIPVNELRKEPLNLLTKKMLGRKK